MYFALRTTPRFSRLIAAIALAIVFNARCANADSHAGIRFDSPGVLDLADPEKKPARVVEMRIDKLGDADAAAIFAMPKPDTEHPLLAFSDDVYHCKPTTVACERSHERALIAASNGAVKREGKRVIVNPVAGAPVIFVDSKTPTTKTADGDEENHWYLGTLPGSDYHRVEVRFGHDAPGSYLVNPANGNVAFVHNGADIIVPSPSGHALITYNIENVALSLRFVSLDANGPRIDLQCTGKPDDDQIFLQFKRWRDDASFDLVMFPKGVTANESLALRLSRGRNGGWTLSASDPQRLATTGFGCR